MAKESKFKNNKAFLIKSATLLFLIFLAAFFLLAYPSLSRKGISDGLELSFSVVIPSLYPFMVLSSFFVESSLCNFVSAFFEKFTRFFLKLPGASTGVILLSLVGGFPVGASMTSSLYKNKQISRETGQRLLMFCVCPGPGFVISAVGVSMLGSQKAGVIMYVSLVLSSLLIGFLTRFISESEDDIFFSEPANKTEPSKALVDAVSKSTGTMILVCGWIMIFSSIIELLDIFNISDMTRLAIVCLFEVTGGCRDAVGVLSFPVIAGIIGWGGLSTHFQLMPFVKALGMKLKVFWAFRALNGALSAIICQLLLNWFPVEENVMLHSNAKLSVTQNSSVLVSVSMFAMCFLFLLGNNFVVKRKKNVNS